MFRAWTALLIVPLLAVILAGCIRDSDPSEEEPTVEEVLRGAREQWDSTESAHFVLEVDGDAYLDSAESIRLRSADGDILRPESVSASARISVALLTLDMSLIAVGGEMFMTNFVSGRWERAPDDFSYDPSILFSDTSGIGPVLEALENSTLDGSERVGSVATHMVSGTVDESDVSDITAGAIEGEDIRVTVWIGVDTAHIYRVTLAEPEGVRDEPATWTLDLNDHGAPVTIEPPPV
ncbi:MAG TPA: LppX_LprAFG lipoprotein [Thermomicrobiales bacterium]|nr:LppX_LprAFG lipoprotein [Thermomicrobiales bacterium]